MKTKKDHGLEIALDNIKIDLSFIVTNKCNLECNFCPCDCGPHKEDFMDRDLFFDFIQGIDPRNINSIEFRGGEPWISFDKFEQLINMAGDLYRPMSLVSNGSFTNTDEWNVNNNMGSFIERVVDSGITTLYVANGDDQRINQNATLLGALQRTVNNSDSIYNGLKVITEYPDMRSPILNVAKDWPIASCKRLCHNWHNKPIKVFISPSGDILFKYCDGHKLPFKMGNITDDIFFDVLNQIETSDDLLELGDSSCQNR